jgi:hypothetical protein
MFVDTAAEQNQIEKNKEVTFCSRLQNAHFFDVVTRRAEVCSTKKQNFAHGAIMHRELSNQGTGRGGYISCQAERTS